MCPLLLPNHSLWQWWDRFLHRQLQFSCRHHSYNTQFHPSHTYVREAAPTVEKDNLCREIASSRIAPVKNFCNFMCQFYKQLLPGNCCGEQNNLNNISSMLYLCHFYDGRANKRFESNPCTQLSLYTKTLQYLHSGTQTSEKFIVLKLK